jgi:ribonuclease R
MSQRIKQAILEVLQQASGSPQQQRDLLAQLRVRGHAKKQSLATLEALVTDGTLVKLRGERYALPRQTDLITGILSLHRDGFGFVAPDGPGGGTGGDLYVPIRYLGGGMDGDKVQLAVTRSRRGESREGRVVKVLERSVRELVGVYRFGRKHGVLLPLRRKERTAFEVLRGTSGGAEDGQLVVGRIDDYPEQDRPGRVSIVKVLGDPTDPAVEILAVAHRFGLPHEFSATALSEAETIPECVNPKDLPGRRDLRELPFVTIDGETAKDFDDAIALVEDSQGYRLWVAIADVAYYVKPGSALDRDALERGTSVYFPGSCLPMLPERLSNGLCSLNPGTDRLVLVAELVFTNRGEKISAEFYPAVINSKGRLTYTAVQHFLDQDLKWPTATSDMFPELRLMAALAQGLNALRRERGSLDFELPEAEILLGENGQPESVRKVERLFAHQLIEEFMLAANEAVASHLERQHRNLLFRIHEPPLRQKLEEFQQFVAHFNYGLRIEAEQVNPRELQRLLSEVKGNPEEKIINQVLLRSMKRASYSADNLGHFGLAAESYCHFTSPIRRYPDLVVHRALRKSMNGEPGYRHEELTVLADDLSRKERRAMDAERDLVALKQCQYMARHVGESFTGVVSGVQPFGLFVELNTVFIEGLIHISALTDDYYHFDEELLRLVGYNRRRIFQVGDDIAVKLNRVNLENREIDFVLDEPVTRAARKQSRGRR